VALLSLRVRHWLVAAAAAVCVVGAAVASAAGLPEQRVKAAFVYKFAEYVEWPAETFARADSPLVFGVVGAQELADELARLTEGRSVGGRPVAVRRLAPGAAWDGIHVVFVGGDEPERLVRTLAAGRGRPVLVVTESGDAPTPGSMINFVVVADKVRFDVALPAAEAARLKISSRLLTVARKVVAP
jgi:hypothetical protein